MIRTAAATIPRACAFLALVVAITPLARADEPTPDAVGVTWEGRRLCEPVFEDAQIRVSRCTFPPGAIHKHHAHPGYLSYILSGGNALLVDEHGSRQVDLASDAVFPSKAIAWHEFTNVGNTTIRVLIVEKKYEPVAATGRQPFN